MYAFTADSKITRTTLPNTHNIPSTKSPEWIEHILQGEMLYTRPYVVLNHQHMSLGGPRGRRVREGRRHVVERCEGINSLITLPTKSGLELYSKICIRLNVAILGFVVRMLEFLEKRKKIDFRDSELKPIAKPEPPTMFDRSYMYHCDSEIVHKTQEQHRKVVPASLGLKSPGCRIEAAIRCDTGSSNGDGLSECVDKRVKREAGNVVPVFMDRILSRSRGKETVYASIKRGVLPIKSSWSPTSGFRRDAARNDRRDSGQLSLSNGAKSASKPVSNLSISILRPTTHVDSDSRNETELPVTQNSQPQKRTSIGQFEDPENSQRGKNGRIANWTPVDFDTIGPGAPRKEVGGVIFFQKFQLDLATIDVTALLFLSKSTEASGQTNGRKQPLCPVRYTQVLKMGKKFGIERIVHDAVANKIQAGDAE
ncbi:hypothetical protein ARMGADRAFT_1035055 [Armillaria gallica]|uniref:Uncharacterized protein n=1 Tax=Armillaria gallica TaxID=47427 RepID=A0A2H3CZB4_ARMGA|nr:hypothetical protein ARMGADRAFT_1035055 [Armillaria gallica]